MEKFFTIFTLLFAVTTARITFDHPSSNNLPVVHNNNLLKSESKSVPEDSNNIVLPSENEAAKSKPNANDIVTETEKSQPFKVPRSDFARFHAINRHFFNEPRRTPARSVHRRPYRHFLNPFVIPRSEIAHGNDVVFSSDHSNVGRRPAKRMKYKHDNNGHRHRRHRYHHHIHHGNDNNNNNNEVNSVMKHKFDREKIKSLVRQHELNKREREVGFMKSIRKFLKHTFE